MNIDYNKETDTLTITGIKDLLGEEEEPTIPPTPVDKDVSLKVITKTMPVLRETDSEKRAGFYGSVVYKNSVHRMFYIADSKSGPTTRSLCRAEYLNNKWVKKGVVRSHIETATVQVEGNTLIAAAIEKTDSGNFQVLKGKSFNFKDWDFEKVNVRQEYPVGDMCTAIGDNIIVKGNDFSEGNYRRPFFLNGKQLTGLLPATIEDGVRWYDTYGLSIIEPGQRAWKSRTKYVGLEWLFKVTDHSLTSRAHQFGPIVPVWVTSDDLIHWKLPFGVNPAIKPENWYSGMVLPWRPYVYGHKLQVYFGGHNFLHNKFQHTPNPVIGTGLAEISKDRFEELFG